MRLHRRCPDSARLLPGPASGETRARYGARHEPCLDPTRVCDRCRGTRLLREGLPREAGRSTPRRRARRKVRADPHVRAITVVARRCSPDRPRSSCWRSPMNSRPRRRSWAPHCWRASPVDGLLRWAVAVGDVASVAARLGLAVTTVGRQGMTASLTGVSEALRSHVRRFSSSAPRYGLHLRSSRQSTGSRWPETLSGCAAGSATPSCRR